MKLDELVEYLDTYLRVREFSDYRGAVNGLQVESRSDVSRVTAAVDATQETIEAAVEAGADLLIVHHGLFWDGEHRVTGRRYRRLRRAIEADLAIYAAHLPLDAHPEVGNNAELARAIGVEVDGRFAEHKGEPIGVAGGTDLDRQTMRERLEAVLGGPVRLIPGGPERLRRVVVLTGGAAGETAAAAEAGFDAIITGEGAHHNYFDAEEGGINLYLGGHYATETWGVRALAAHLGERFGLPWQFIDRPTGL